MAQNVEQLAKGVQLRAYGVVNGGGVAQLHQRLTDGGFQDGDDAGQLALRGLGVAGEVVAEDVGHLLAGSGQRGFQRRNVNAGIVNGEDCH